MGTKEKQTETEASPTMIKRKYLDPAQCRASAARISAEMREDRDGRAKWGDQWAAYVEFPNGTYYRGKKPLTLIWPGDMEQGQGRD